MAKRIFLAVISVGLLCLLFACGDQSNNISNKTVASLAISPTTASLTVGSREGFSVNATFTDGSTAAIVPVWTTTGSLGVVTSVGYIGLFTAKAVGSGEVIATSGGFSAEATIIVTAAPTPEPGGLTTIEVSPTFINLPARSSQVFRATGINNSGEAIGITPTWTLSGDPIGTISFSGATATLETTATGKATITCISGEVETTVPVTVEGTALTITVEADTYVDEASPTVTEEGSTTLQAGFVSGTAKHLEAYFRFPLTAVPAGATIESATLKLFVNSADATAFQFYNLNSAFDSTTTWNSKPTDGSSLMSVTFSANQYNNISDNSLLTQVRSWYSAPASNFGLALRQDTVSASSTVTILSKENGTNPPVLTITYK